jgi:Raf kinase inhibitor-like YbhB/YbcL family protein
MTLLISSAAFADNCPIPERYTCDGLDVSPPLEWSGIPSNAKSLALIVEDPDAPDPQAPKTTWVHWMLYNIPPTVSGLPEDITHHAMPAGTLDGLNDWMRTGYGGPCPPVGRHRYFHRLFALSVVLPDLHRPRRPQLLQAMHGKVLAEAALIGLYACT